MQDLIRIDEKKLTDGSRVYDLEIRTNGESVVIAMPSRKDAERALDALRCNCSHRVINAIY